MTPRSISKPLFEAGSQCAKRLYLDCHEPDSTPKPSEYRRELVDIGEHLVELASKAFPAGLSLVDADLDGAIEKTREFLAAGKPGVLFHSGFRGGNSEVRIDIALVSAQGELDIFEVKAGTSVKPRHIQDVALQLHAIERCDVKVKSASILHLDPKYRHDGGKEYPVQKLFKSVDVTEKSRSQLGRVRTKIDEFSVLLEDSGTIERPTGTWCNLPLPCERLVRCRSKGPEFPLIDLPQLKADLEGHLHEQGIEDIANLSEDQTGLTQHQRRVVRAVANGAVEIEPFVPAELNDIDYPIAFTHVQWHLQVLPRFEGSRPWQRVPLAWSIRTIAEDGSHSHQSFCADSADDPRAKCVSGLADALKQAGTVVVFGRGFDERIRAMLEDFPDAKSDLRMLMQAPLLELGNLIQHGVYHPSFHGRHDLATVASALLEQDNSAPGLADDAAAEQACRRIIKSRTRQTTRQTLAEQLTAFVERQSELMAELFDSLGKAEVSKAEASTE